jgi:predicted nucleic-acid-binding protein
MKRLPPGSSMNGIDTNILVRFFARDDKVQAKQAEGFLGKTCSPANPGWISVIVLCEMVWILSRGYSYSKDQLIPVIDHLLRAQFLKLEDATAVRAALGVWENHTLDFSDALLAARNQRAGCASTYTFDHKALASPGFTRLPKA